MQLLLLAHYFVFSSSYYISIRLYVYKLKCNNVVYLLLHSFLFLNVPEYCEKYAKPEEVGAPSDDKSSEEELSEDEYDSSDETVVGKPDL